MTTIAEDLAPTGTLRASINLGNPVLAQGTADAPSGVTVDLAREIAARLGLGLRFVCFDAARDSFQAVLAGEADICFLAVEPARQAEIAFTAPYAVIEGAYAVADDSPLRAVADVDQPGVSVGVKLGSAYDLFLTRTLRHAQVVRGDDGIDVFRAGGLNVAAGIRAPLAAAVAQDPRLRMLDGAFMQIQQAVGTGKHHQPATVAFLSDLVEELKVSGFVAAALDRSGQSSAAVAPPR
jgi:polar amino acid transport system substrate-binding protein